MGRKVGLWASAIAVAVTLAACGEETLDEGSAEDGIGSEVERQAGVKIASTDCPSDVSTDAGTEFDCTVEDNKGDKATVTVKLINENADFRILDIKPTK